ncbi:efflux RND transporter periplasmic adaptor subunit [soil metagenome]
MITNMKLLRLALIAFLLASVACKPAVPSKNGKDANPEIKRDKPFLTPVLAQKVKRGDVLATIATTGSVVPLRSRILRTEEPGRLHFESEWREGDFVEKGTLIAHLEPTSLDSDIERAKADVRLQQQALDISKKSMDSAVKEYKTVQDLYSRGISALKDVDSMQLSMERAINVHKQDEIGLSKAQDALGTLQDRIERLELRAPFDGLLVSAGTISGTKPFITNFGSETITDYDDRLVSAEFALCGVIDVSKVYLRCDVTPRDIDQIRPEQEARASIYAAKDIAVNGKVAEISRSVSQDTRAFQVDVLVDNPEMALRPGMFGRVEIVTQRRHDAISIDKSLITRRNNRDIVFLVDKPAEADYSVAREVEVQTGLEGRDELEVTWGIKEGDSIVVRGFEVLQDRAPVSVIYADQPVEGDKSAPQQLKPQTSASDKPTS